MNRIGIGAASCGWIVVCVIGVLLGIGSATAQEATALGGGDAHTCAIVDGGRVKCWGRQEQNQIAAGQYLFSTGTPVDLVGIDNAQATTGGYEFTCALLRDGRIKCFGYNRWGQLGSGATNCTYAEGAGDCALVVGIDAAIDVAAGGNHSCAVESDGSVHCWGLNNHGQLGLGSQAIGESNQPLPVPGITDAFAVAAGTNHSCALVGAGAVRCWGRNTQGQLGIGNASADPGVLSPTDVPGISDATAIVAGDAHTCVLRASGAVSCWGHEDHGALGVGENPDSSFVPGPASVGGISDAVAVSAGDYHTCVGHADGTVSCFGDNYYGQVGDGSNRNKRFVPTRVAGVSNASLVLAAGSHSCARVATDPVNVKCWGSGNMGQIGNGAIGGVNEQAGAAHVVGSPFDTIFGGRGGSFEPTP